MNERSWGRCSFCPYPRAPVCCVLCVCARFMCACASLSLSLSLSLARARALSLLPSPLSPSLTSIPPAQPPTTSASPRLHTLGATGFKDGAAGTGGGSANKLKSMLRSARLHTKHTKAYAHVHMGAHTLITHAHTHRRNNPHARTHTRTRVPRHTRTFPPARHPPPIHETVRTRPRCARLKSTSLAR